MNKQELEKLKGFQEVEIIYKRPLFKSMPKIKSSLDADQLFRKIIDLNRIDYKEFFWIILLNNSNKVLGYSQIAIGDTKGTIVNVKEVFTLALKSNSSAIILCHNHPSGTLKPSKQDLALTEKINMIGSLFGINLLDHLIITSESYYSFSDEGKILTPSNTLPF
jgi:DNA repair protein RadC